MKILSRSERSTLWPLVAALLIAAWVSIANAQPNSASSQLAELLKEDWQWRLRDAPENATMLGDNRFNDRLTDLSPKAIKARNDRAKELLGRLEKIDKSNLTGQDLISYDLFKYEQQIAIEAARFPGEVMSLDQLDGPQLALGQLASFAPFRTAEDYRNYIARLHAWPRYLDQFTALLKRGIELRWVQPKVPLRPSRHKSTISSKRIYPQARS